VCGRERERLLLLIIQDNQVSIAKYQLLNVTKLYFWLILPAQCGFEYLLVHCNHSKTQVDGSPSQQIDACIITESGKAGMEGLVYLLLDS
jgi:hypothetical protein